MTGERGAGLLFLGLMMILPLSALLVRRLPARSIGRMALAWVAIFLAALGLVTLWTRS